jgi:hypothetical protein
MSKNILATLCLLLMVSNVGATNVSGKQYRMFEDAYMKNWHQGYCLLNDCRDAMAKKHASMINLKLEMEF